MFFKSYLVDYDLVELELGHSLSECEPSVIDDDLLNLVVGNPIHVFKLFNRLVMKLKTLQRKISDLPVTGENATLN